jgi:hypothetical protein
MGPGEVLVTLGLLVFLPVTILRMTFKYKERKLKLQEGRTADANSMTLTELEVVVEDAVRRGIEPLEERLFGVERRLERSLPSHEERPGPSLLEEEEDEEAPTKTVGKIQRIS